MKKISTKKLLNLQNEKSNEKFYLQEEKEISLIFLHDSKEGKETKFTWFTLWWKSFKRGESTSGKIRKGCAKNGP